MRGLELSIDSDVPSGAGLSSSAALECAVGAAASDLFDLGLLGSDERRVELAAACVRAENDIAMAATGGMDQAVALRSREGALLLLDCQDGSVEHVRAELDGHVVLVTDTRSPHQLADGQYEARRRDCEAAAAAAGVASLREVEPRTCPRSWVGSARSSAAAPGTSSRRTPACVSSSTRCAPATSTPSAPR
ncbi:GHMP family kinase ATP-binding protein [Janibacter melonis]|uniref:GHMP family kinase ATP-binding protein n=1 Tax=Janibacter melonis TaxID=262209 RepID=UPI0020956AA8|nr:hypothetical protein [Janibacter melonis]